MSLIKAAHHADRTVFSLSRILNIIGICALISMMLLTVVDVILRYFLNKPVTGTLEITEYIMVIVVFFGVAWCAERDGHTKVDLLVNRFSSKVQLLIQIATRILLIPVLACMAWQSFQQAIYAREIHLASTMLEIPAYPFFGATAIGCTLFTLVLLTNLLQFIIKAVKGVQE